MNSILDTIVLEPVVCDQATLPDENKYYDPTIRFLKTSGRDSNAPTFDIEKIVTQYVTDRNEVLRLTLPAQLYTRRRGPQLQVPALWEMGGLNRGGYGRPSWCVIVGSSIGERANRHDVCQVRYPMLDRSVHPSGRHALVATQPETMFIVAQKTNNAMYALIYKVDEVLDWPTAEALALTSDRPYVALNCSLVGIRQTQGGEVLGWADNKRLKADERDGVVRLFRLAQEKLLTPAYSPCNIELFWDAAPNSAERNMHEAPEDSDVHTYTVDPNDFIGEVISRIGDYRKALSSSDLSIRSHPIPASIQYERNDDDSVSIFVEVPSALGNYNHFSIATKLTNDLPASLVIESNLSWDCTSIDTLISKLEFGTPITRNIFTFC